ncbi:hemerythrin domain-containing protein [Allorhizocola rhizosphaerae]|uniref:hemerythrin domain-containing protein n=1 Tax=Allorhizocola rhizosphaerae TaxID=1872709 RepID=UPI001FEC7423|nr:hemerythrin domain-containing protein [Allorhizocola rhizosphaerae]
MKTYLPPLPVLPGENKTYQYVPPGRSIIAVLADDHEELADRIAELASAPIPDRRQADCVTAAITRHLSAERQYLYPVADKLFPGQANGVADRQIEHDQTLLQDLTSLGVVRPGSQAFRQSIQAIATGWQRHRQTCERDIFPHLLSAVSEVDLIRLGNRVEVAREAAPSRAHPGAPQRPPWNKLTDAILGAIDKIRDLATGRKTYM